MAELHGLWHVDVNRTAKVDHVVVVIGTGFSRSLLPVA